jgi:hypothetical protein
MPHILIAPLTVLLQLSTKLLDSGKLKDSLKLVYDFQNRFGEYGTSSS